MTSYMIDKGYVENLATALEQAHGRFMSELPPLIGDQLDGDLDAIIEASEIMRRMAEALGIGTIASSTND